MGICSSKQQVVEGDALYEEKQKEAAAHEGRHMPAEPTDAWIEPGTNGKATEAGKSDPFNACIIFVLGGPGSGKGTQCEMIAKEYGFTHFSVGDLLREEVKKGTELGKEAESIMKEGKLVPTEVTVKLLRAAIDKSSNDKFLIDGFPREVHQAEAFEKEVSPPQLVIFYDCPEEVMLERLQKRAQTSGREDDNEETIRKRFKTFLECTMPVAEYYEHQHKLVKISAVPPPEEVFKDSKKAVERACHNRAGAMQEAVAA